MKEKDIKVGTITFHNAINYGALLQTYALQKSIINMGYEAEVIDYSNSNIDKQRKKPCWKEYRNPLNYHNDRLIYKVESVKEKKLHDFLNTRIIRTEKATRENITDITSKLDVVFTGSDQVWNDSITNFDDTYYLDFIPAEKRCSYAASIGKEIIPTENILRMQRLLSNYHAISVREETAKEALKTQLGISAIRVLDPTLLIAKKEYEEIAKKYTKRGYVLLYMLLYSESLVQSAKKMAKEKGVPVLCINSSGKRIKGVVDCSDAGIEEWLGLFLNAEFIFTNSFHGTAFAINFNKQFNVELPPARIQASSRVKDILKMFDLEKQVIEKGEIKSNIIKYELVNEKLNSEREKSREFLLKAIENRGGVATKRIERSVVLISWNHCSGCGFCERICPVDAIEMKSDSHGFMHPVVNLNKCIQCGKCLRECPYKNKERENQRTDNSSQHIFAAWSKNTEVVANSSSGGIFYELAEKTIQEGGVVYGAAFDEKFSLNHRRVDRIKDIKPLMGSKYVQSNAFTCFDYVLKDIELGKKVLFVGTPCQVAALKKLQDKGKNNLLLVDFVCHGVPSQMLVKEHIRYVESFFNKQVKAYIPRSKVLGWRSGEVVVFENGVTEYKHPVTQAYSKIFYSNCALRGSCYNCPYTDFNRPGDLTIADYWGIEQKRPDLYQKEGVSMILVNSEKGESFLNSMDTITLSKTEKNTIIKEKQPHLFYPVKQPDTYEKFWREYKEKGWSYIIKKYAECEKKDLLKWKIKKILGKVK